MARIVQFVLVSLITIILLQLLLPAEAAFEMACMEKCLKTRRCKKYGQVVFDSDCDKQCKKKCYKVTTTTASSLISLKFLLFSPVDQNLNSGKIT